MLCAYLDDAGNSGARLDDPQQPYHHVGAVLIPESKWLAVRDDMLSIARDALGGTLPEGFEFHGKELYRGEGIWSDLKFGRRLRVFEDSLSLLTDHDLHMVVGTCDKKRLVGYASPLHPHSVAFWLCLERVAEYVGNHGELGFIVADDSAQKTRDLAKAVLDNYRRTGPPFGRPVDLSSVIDTVHFMSSNESLHIQLCDLALYVIRKKRASQDDKYKLASRVLPRIKSQKTFPY